MVIRTGIAPWLPVKNAGEALDYYVRAFGVTEIYRLEDDRSMPIIVHLTMDAADFWIQEDPGIDNVGKRRGVSRLILTVDNPDLLFTQALSAGATVVSDVGEDHGWRIGRLIDPMGYHWEIGKPLG